MERPILEGLFFQPAPLLRRLAGSIFGYKHSKDWCPNSYKSYKLRHQVIRGDGRKGIIRILMTWNNVQYAEPLTSVLN